MVLLHIICFVKCSFTKFSAVADIFWRSSSGKSRAHVSFWLKSSASPAMKWRPVIPSFKLSNEPPMFDARTIFED